MSTKSQTISELKHQTFLDASKVYYNLKNQIAKERPRCKICGQFFGIQQILNKEVISIIKQDNHFRNEQQWYEHKKCR